jgi:methyl-accepting chemotaxis protein
MRATNSAFTLGERNDMSKWADAAEFYGAEMRKIFDAVKGRQGKIAETLAAAAVVPVASVVKNAKSADAPAAVVVPIAMFAAPETNDMIKAGKDRFAADLIKGVGDMSKSKTEATLKLAQTADDAFRKLLLGVLSTVALGVLLGLALLLMLPKLVSGPLTKLTGAVDNMSKGALDNPVDAGGVVEFEGLAKSLDRMRVAQQTLVARMKRV